MSSLQADYDIAAVADITAATCHQSRESEVMRRSLVSRGRDALQSFNPMP